MDGAGVVAVIIFLAFFANLSIKPFQPLIIKKENEINQQLLEQQQVTTFNSQPPSNSTSAAPPENYNVQTTAPPADAAPTIPNLQADYSTAAYQYVSYDRMDGLIRRYNKNLPQAEVNQIKMAVNLYCKEKDIDPRLALALMARESSFNPQAVSTSGAIGLGQIMPFNYTELGINNPNDINQNVKGTVYYLEQKIKDWSGYNNQIDLALASYLKGTGDIRRANGQYDDHTKTYIEDILKIRASI